MKHIVFLTGNYFPNHSAVSNCVEKVVLNLEKDIKITVICPDSNNTEILNEIHFNHSVIKFRYNNSNKFLRRFNRGMNKFSLDFNLVKMYIEQLNNITDSIDMIISAAMPYETVKASIEYKENFNRNVKIVPYLFDPYANNENLHYFNFMKFFKKKWIKEFEKDMVCKSNNLILMHHLRKYINENFSEYTNKFHFVEHPLFTKQPLLANKEINFNKKINFVYSGSFYKKIRNPEFMLELFSELSKKNKAIFNIYSFGDCNELLEKYSNEFSDIINHGSVSSSIAFEKMINADVLIALGNSTSTQAPSKIFEYMTLEKYIVYIYKNDLDRNIEILSHYPRAIIISEDYKLINTHIESIFTELKNGKEIFSEKLSNDFIDATPEYTGNLIRKMLKK